MGSKNRIAKYIVPIIQKYIDDNSITDYYEPFCGGCNVIDKIKCHNKYASDISSWLIEFWLSDFNDLPDSVSREHYSEIRNIYNSIKNGDTLNTSQYSKSYIAAIGFLASYNGRFFDGGYGGYVKLKNGKVRDYYSEYKRNAIKQKPLLDNVKFTACDYSEIQINNSPSVIYCDIPYDNTKQYSSSKNFNYERFWNWAREMSKNNIVLISELNAPDDFECIWEREVLRTIDVENHNKATEKLFKYKE